MPSGHSSIPPVFAFGFERSGTTLLSMMLGAHPEIAVPHALNGLWFRLAAQHANDGEIDTKEGLQRITAKLQTDDRLTLWDVEIAPEEILPLLRPGDFSSIVRAYHELYAAKKGKKYWGNLDIATLDHMDQVNRWFPTAKFIHIVRDGRDVALSHETMPYGASNAVACAQKWLFRVHSNLKMGAMLTEDRYCVVRYEDLIMQPETSLQKICDFIGLPYDAQMLQYSQLVDKKLPADKRWLWPAIKQPPLKSKAYGWKTKMGKSKRAAFETVADQLLKEQGYETFDSVPRTLGRFAYELYSFIDQNGRFNRVRRRLGLSRPSKLERQAAMTAQNADTHQQAFDALVDEGVYDEKFEHATEAKTLFTEIIESVLSDMSGQNSVLEAGCGTGAWLYEVAKIMNASGVSTNQFYGFDITEGMVRVAQRKLANMTHADNIKEGDILLPDSYRFGHRTGFDLVFAYDVVQQVPRGRQLEACERLLDAVDPGGCLVVFDHDRYSRHGRIMGIKKFLTEYLRFPLVPRYYCNAKYPALRRIAEQLGRQPGIETRIVMAKDERKRALIANRSMKSS